MNGLLESRLDKLFEGKLIPTRIELEVRTICRKVVDYDFPQDSHKVYSIESLWLNLLFAIRMELEKAKGKNIAKEADVEVWKHALAGMYCPGNATEEAKELWNTTTELRAALKQANEALTALLQIYASDQCDAADVLNTNQKISDAGGTLGFIAQIQSRNREALKFNPK